MRWIILSPHFDDAVLSCGGLIWELTQKNLPVEIWTICAGDAPSGPLSPLAMDCHRQWGLETAEEVVAARTRENEEAAAIVGASTVNFSIPDCIYRQSSQGDLLYTQDVFSGRHPEEKKLDSEIAVALVTELQPEDSVVSPLSIGNHVDHVLTRSMAGKLRRPLWYYADIPYLLNYPVQLKPATTGLNHAVFAVSRTGLHRWQAGIAAYKSQIGMLFNTEEAMEEAIYTYWEIMQGIHLWHLS